MKKINKNNIKKYIIIFLILIIFGLIVFAVIYAFKNYNRSDIFTMEKSNTQFTLGSKQLDSIKMPDVNLEIKYDKLPETKNTIDEIDVKTLKKLFQTSQKSLLVLVKDDCEYCNDFIPKLEEALKENDLNSYKINLYNLNNSDYKEMIKYINYEGTPTFYLIDNGKVTHSLSGTVDKETLQAFIDYFYYRTN